MTKPAGRNRGLGRGLSALMSDVELDQKSVPTSPTPQASSPQAEQYLPIETIFPNADQPRRVFKPDDLQDLANSIRAKGVIQPLIVRPRPGHDGEYQIVAGERRWRAAQLAQLHAVPAVIRPLDDQSVLEIAIIENIQRADLNPIEEAAGYKQLMDKFGHTQEKMAEALGKSRSHIANLLRLLNLPQLIQDHLEAGRLTSGHARALITSDNPEGLAVRVISQGLSVRETERLAKQVKAPNVKSAQKPEKDADTRALEGDLTATLKMAVRINHSAKNDGGEVVVQYKDFEQLDELVRRLGGF